MLVFNSFSILLFVIVLHSLRNFYCMLWHVYSLMFLNCMTFYSTLLHCLSKSFTNVALVNCISISDGIAFSGVSIFFKSSMKTELYYSYGCSWQDSPTVF